MKNKGPSINEHENNLETVCFKASLIDPLGLQVLVGTLSLNFQAICKNPSTQTLLLPILQAICIMAILVVNFSREGWSQN